MFISSLSCAFLGEESPACPFNAVLKHNVVMLHSSVKLNRVGTQYYRLLPGKRSWALFHNFLFFAILGTYLVYWALTMCKIKTQLVGMVKPTITTATRTRLPLASVFVRIVE